MIEMIEISLLINDKLRWPYSGISAATKKRIKITMTDYRTKPQDGTNENPYNSTYVVAG